MCICSGFLPQSKHKIKQDEICILREIIVSRSYLSLCKIKTNKHSKCKKNNMIPNNKEYKYKGKFNVNEKRWSTHAVRLTGVFTLPIVCDCVHVFTLCDGLASYRLSHPTLCPMLLEMQNWMTIYIGSLILNVRTN